MNSTWIILGVIAAIAVFLVIIYNRLVALRQTRENAFADIDVQLLQRADLVPNLIETVKGYATHEKQLFENVTNARASAMSGSSVNDKIAANAQLSGALMNLMAVAENYPALKADANFAQLQSELSALEATIAAARRFFNNATGEFNTAIQQFPAVVFARSFGFTEQPFFELDDAKKAEVQTPPKVSFS
jgi:LemA protein